MSVLTKFLMGKGLLRQIQMNFTESIKTGVLKTFVYKGRASRSEYWYFGIFLMVVSFLLGYLQIYLTNKYLDLHTRDLTNYIFTAVGLVIWFPMLSATTRRLHDVNKRGWWQLVTLTIIGIPYLCFLTIKASSEGSNRFGSINWSPKDGRRVAIIALIVWLIFCSLQVVLSGLMLKETFMEGLGWTYSEDIDSSTKEKFLIARHFGLDSENRKAIIQFGLICADNKKLGLTLSVYDNPNLNFGNPDTVLPVPINKKDQKILASASLGGMLLPAAPLDNSNQVVFVLPKEAAGKILDGQILSIKLNTGRGNLQLNLEAKDEIVKKVISQCPH